MLPVPPRLTLQELAHLFMTGGADPTDLPVHETLLQGRRFIEHPTQRPQIFDFGRMNRTNADIQMSTELWSRRLLRLPFPTTIFTFAPHESRITLVVLEDATVETETKPVKGCTAFFIISQFLGKPPRLDAFSWFTVPREGYVETAATELSRVAGESDDSFKHFTLACTSKVIGLSMILNTKGIRKRHEAVPLKLNQKRARSGKPPLDAVTYVDLTGSPYHASASQEGKGGEKAMHFRRGHIRHYDDGSATWVRDTIVKAEGQLKERVRYQVR